MHTIYDEVKTMRKAMKLAPSTEAKIQHFPFSFSKPISDIEEKRESRILK